MLKKVKQDKTIINALYNYILLLSRNKLFYTKFNLIDNFQNRIYLIFIHISFIFIKIKQYSGNKKYKIFYQELFDLLFNKIELNMRELGFGDVTINKNMKFLVKVFYNILLFCESFSQKSNADKKKFLNNFLEVTVNEDIKNMDIVEYFDKYQAFCFDLSSDSVLSGELKFNYK